MMASTGSESQVPPEHRRTGSTGTGSSGSDATPPASGGIAGTGKKSSTTSRSAGPGHARRRSTVSNPYDAFFQADAKFVGSSSLISSPNTIEPTDKIFVRPPPMPSVHTDGRGEGEHASCYIICTYVPMYVCISSESHKQDARIFAFLLSLIPYV